MIAILIYIAIFVLCFVLASLVTRGVGRRITGMRKTVTFGDESAVMANRLASVVSVLVVFLLWGAFTGSKLLPGFLHVPGPFIGDAVFTYTLETPDGGRDEARVTVMVRPANALPPAPAAPDSTGPARDDVVVVPAQRSTLIQPDENDEITRAEGARIVSINGAPIVPGARIDTDFGAITMSQRGALNIRPNPGLQMEPIWLPPPEAVWTRLVEIARDGFRTFTLFEHLGWSMLRVLTGFVLGALVGIPLGYAMGLSGWARGWFEPIVEFMRPVPPLALIPLVIIWAGIGEAGKIILLFLAALWIMTIAARAGVSGVAIAKVHAAYSLGASKWQILRHVIVPNSLPEIFTGARVAMGVCWGTVVAAELVAAEKGAGMMIMVASRFQNTDIVIMGIILIGLIGFGIDLLMRWAERLLVPWKGKS